MRTFFQNINNSQRYNIKNLVRIERKRTFKTIILSIIVSIKYIIVVMLRNTFTIVFLFKFVIVVTSYVHNYNILITCFHCNKLDYIKFNCFNFNKFSIIRIREIVNEFNDEIKKILELVNKIKKI